MNDVPVNSFVMHGTDPDVSVSVAGLPTAIEDIRKTLAFVYNGGSVKRFHTVSTIVQDTDARHSYGVAWLIWMLSDGLATGRLLMAGLAHDLAEQQVGDVPSPAKRALGIGKGLDDLEDAILGKNGVLFALSEAEARILKLADCFDGMLFCIQERFLGNKNTDIVFRRYTDYVMSMDLSGTALNVALAIHALYQESVQ